MNDYPLDDLVVIDLSVGIAGGYCTKLLVDGGADVVKVEPPTGDPLRRRPCGGVVPSDGHDGPLFQYLAAGKKSVVADGDDAGAVAGVRDLLRSADIIVWSSGSRLTLSLIHI